MSIRIPIAPREWYHCFNRGIDKRKVFDSVSDYKRFLVLLYVCNSKNNIHVSDLKQWSHEEIFRDADLEKRRGDSLVEIGAYTLMKNHFHLLIREQEDGGITTFMRKVMTGYTMYFNKKNNRIGTLFSGPFKSKHIDDDEYFQYVISYIHLNPTEHVAEHWKEGVGDIRKIAKFLNIYPYSSFTYFLSRCHLDKKGTANGGSGLIVPQAIISDAVFDAIETVPSMEEMLRGAQMYYQEQNQNNA